MVATEPIPLTIKLEAVKPFQSSQDNAPLNAFKIEDEVIPEYAIFLESEYIVEPLIPIDEPEAPGNGISITTCVGDGTATTECNPLILLVVPVVNVSIVI